MNQASSWAQLKKSHHMLISINMCLSKWKCNNSERGACSLVLRTTCESRCTGMALQGRDLKIEVGKLQTPRISKRSTSLALRMWILPQGSGCWKVLGPWWLGKGGMLALDYPSDFSAWENHAFLSRLSHWASSSQMRTLKLRELRVVSRVMQ